jgi:hypothetical protein
LIFNQQVVKGTKGYPLISCSLNDTPIGCFPYTIQGDKLFILSFLPAVSAITPEGEKLYRILRLSKDELIYLGMDKLSFFLSVDFDEIPILKNALIESGLWLIKQNLGSGSTNGNVSTAIDKVKTRFIKNFFQKTEARIKTLIENDFPNTVSSEEWV